MLTFFGMTPGRILAAYTVKDRKFAVVVERPTSYFSVGLAGSETMDGLIITPVEKGHHGVTEKLYEIPVKITNRSDQSIDLKNYYLTFTDDDLVDIYSYGPLTADSVGPAQEILATLTIRFSRPYANWIWKLDLWNAKQPTSEFLLYRSKRWV